jgi:hypothetical protein
MSYGTIKVDTITFTDNSVDKSVSLSGLIQNPTFTGNITVTGTISGDVIRGGTTVSGATVTGTTANFVSGVFTTQISGATVTGTTASFTSGVFTNISGTTATITSGIIASGTAAAPSLAILADLDTGLFSPGANELAVATNGTGRLFVDASGNVGVKGSTIITTSAVSAPTFQIGDGAGSPAVVMYSATTGASQISFADSTTGTGSYDGYILYNQSSQYLEFGTAASPRLRITSAGLVGIGNSSPGGQLTVYSAGNQIRVESPTSSNADILFRENAVTKWTAGYVPFISGFRFSNGSSDILTLTNTGNVGIGTTAATEGRLTVQAVDDTATGGIALRGYNVGSANGERTVFITALSQGGSYWANAHYSSWQHIFSTNGSEKARLTSDGKLLVGTSTARGVGSSSGQNNRIQITDVGGSIGGLSTYYYSADGGTNTWNFCKSRGSSDGSFTIVNSGDGLGTINWIGADGNGFTSIAASISAAVDGTPGANDMPGRLVFSTTADGASTPTERLRITSAGNVGIGTTSPRRTLEVSGADGLLCINATDTSTGTSQLLFGDNDDDNIGRIYYDHGTDNMAFWTNTSEKARIDTSGRLLVGTSSSNGAFNSAIQIAGNNVAGTQLISRFDNSTGGPVLYFAKSRSATVGTNTIAQDGDEVGVIAFYAADGANYVPAANILVAVDGTPGTSDMPGRLVFSTTAKGAANSTERVRITEKGEFQMGLSQGSNNILRQIARDAGNSSETFTSANMGMSDNITALINISIGGRASTDEYGGCLIYWYMPYGSFSIIHQTIVTAFKGSGVVTFSVSVSGNSLVVTKDSDVGVFVTVIGGGGTSIS